MELEVDANLDSRILPKPYNCWDIVKFECSIIGNNDSSGRNIFSQPST
jgi:hypothetical protein